MPELSVRTKRGQHSSRGVALDALLRIRTDGAYANLLLGPLLERSGLGKEDRAFVTKLVYGTTRMTRACDALVDRFISHEPDALTREVLRLGAFQLAFGDVPPHAAVAETVSLAPVRSRGFVNAVLRRVASTPVVWSSEAERLSYPDWIIERLNVELGPCDALATLETMNQPARVTQRADGYVQDVASQEVVRAVGAESGELVVDVCAGPGGKATGIAATGARVAAFDISRTRAVLVSENARRTGHRLEVAVADGRRLPMPDRCADRVLVDAPCSGLGVLRRRADARWKIQPSDITELSTLQREILHEAARLVRTGGLLVYSVCTLTAEESIDHPTPEGFEAVGRSGDDTSPPLGDHWENFGQGARLLPHRIDSDGMVLLRYRRCL